MAPFASSSRLRQPESVQIGTFVAPVREAQLLTTLINVFAWWLGLS